MVLQKINQKYNIYINYNIFIFNKNFDKKVFYFMS